MSLKAKEVAEYFLALEEEDAGDTISNLKLQKLCYFAQGFYLAINGEKLFNEEIEAWTHGPVIPDLYHEYKIYENQAIPKPKNLDFSIYKEDTIEFLNEIYSVFGQYSAWVLRNITHGGKPWKDVYKRGGGVISVDSMKKWFKKYLEDEEE